MKRIYLLIIFAAFLSRPGLGLASAAEVRPKDFADATGQLDGLRAALYIVHRDNLPLSKFNRPGEATLDRDKLVKALWRELDDLRSKTGHTAPWTWQELDAVFPAKRKEDSGSERPAWRNIPGITKPHDFVEVSATRTNIVGGLGPLRVRKNSAELGKSDLTEAKGATLAFADNFLLDGNGAWNSEGLLFYPVRWDSLFDFATPGRSLALELGPSVNWKLAETEESGQNDAQELTFSLPLLAYFSPGHEKMVHSKVENLAAAREHGYSRLWVLQAKPYFNTDFRFRHRIFGTELSAEYVGTLFGNKNLYMGSYHNLSGSSSIQYQVRLIPKFDYSATDRGGPRTSRQEGDDWSRIGGLASLDFRLGGGLGNPFDIGASIEILETLSGSGGYSKLVKYYGTWWLSENLGLTAEYSEGDTPIAQKEIEQVTLGLEFRF